MDKRTKKISHDTIQFKYSFNLVAPRPFFSHFLFFLLNFKNLMFL